MTDSAKFPEVSAELLVEALDFDASASAVSSGQPEADLRT